MARKHGADTSGDVLDRRALNRATLARQLLLQRVDRDPLDVVEHLVGLQAQAPFPPYYGLWSRVEGFTPPDLADRLLDRSVVRIVLMRGTVHLVTARDALRLRPLVQPLLDAYLTAPSAYRSALEGIDLDELAEFGRTLLGGRPAPLAEVRPAVAERWPGCQASTVAQALRSLLPLVQVPPRAVWGRSGQPVWTTAQSWLGAELDQTYGIEVVARRYLGAFGPATPQDMQTWSGLKRLGEVFERLRPTLRTFRDEHGRELFDLPDAPRPTPDTPAPVRLAAEFDNLVLSHADRTRVMTEEHRRRLLTPNAVFPGTVLVDGFLRGVWRLERTRAAATLTVEEYEPITGAARGAVEEEGGRLLDFAAPGAAHDVQWRAAG